MGNSKSVQVPKYGQIVKTYDELTKYCDTRIVHLAVYRIRKYWHHFIIAKKKRIQYKLSLKNFFTGPGQVVEDDWTLDKDIKEAIKKGKLYIIEAPDYPKTNEEIKEMENRWQEELGNQDYDLAYHNCEHLVTYILTGKARSEQIQNACHCKMAIVDFISCIVCHGKRSLLKAFVTLKPSPMVITFKEMIFKKITIKAICLTVDKSSKMILEHVSQNGNVFALSAAHCSLICSGAIATVFTGIVEGRAAVYIIYDLKQKMNAGKISKEDYDREKWKTVAEAISSTVGTVVGAVLGQWLCPIPILGYIGGAFFGNLIGRVIGVFISGKVYDFFWKKKKEA